MAGALSYWLFWQKTYTKNLPVRNKNKPLPSKHRKKPQFFRFPLDLWVKLINLLGVHLMPVSLAEAQRMGWRQDGLQIEELGFLSWVWAAICESFYITSPCALFYPLKK